MKTRTGLLLLVTLLTTSCKGHATQPILANCNSGLTACDDSQLLPQQIKGLQFWVSADYGTYQNGALTTPAITDNVNLAGWVDRSGQGQNMQFTGGTPKFRTSIQHGLPAASFAGTDFIQAVVGNAAVFPQPMTLIACVKFTGLSGGVNGVFGSDGLHSTIIGFIGVNGTSGNAIVRFGPELSIGSFSDTSNAHVFVGAANGASSFGYIDRVKSSVGDAGTNSLSGIDLGDTAGAANGMQGYVFEAMFYNRVLTTSEITALTSYLSSKWGLGI